MISVLYLLPVIFICKNLNAQQNNNGDTLQLKPRIFKATIFTNKAKNYYSGYGYLANLSDSGLQLSSSPIYFSINNKTNFSSTYNYDQLQQVIIQRKGAIGRGAGYGALIGLVAGVATGLIGSKSENDNGFQLFSPGEIILSLGIAGAVSGALIGIIAGALSHNTFIIHGNKNKYETMRKSIFNKLLRNNSEGKIINRQAFECFIKMERKLFLDSLSSNKNFHFCFIDAGTQLIEELSVKKQLGIAFIG